MGTTKKHRQHHVWQSYLREWLDGDQLHCLQDGKIRRASVKDVAVQRHFYKLNALTLDQIEFIRKYWIAPSPKSSWRIHEGYITMFSVWANLRRDLTSDQVAAYPEYVDFLGSGLID